MDLFSTDADARNDGTLAVLRSFLFFGVVAVTLCAQSNFVLADGGVVQIQRSAGRYIITVFTAPVPLRAGPAEISILIQDNQNPVLDAKVAVILRRDGVGTIKAEAGREQAKNKLLYTALVRFPEAGCWEIEVLVAKNTEEHKITGVMTVAPSRHFLLTHWWVLSLPPVTIVLFVINQWLKRRQKTSVK